MSKNTNLRKITNYLTADNNTLSSNVSQTITGSLTVTGNLTAQQFILSSSVTYLTESFASGSHKFGDSSDDNHNFTGSLIVGFGGSTELNVQQTGVNIGNTLTDNHIISGSLRINPNGLFVSSSGFVGIGTTSPSQLLEVVGGEIKAGRVDSSIEGGQVSFGRSTDNATSWYIDNYGNAASTQLRFVNVTNAVVAMTITGSNVGIGTSSPSEKLHIYGGGLGPELRLEGTWGSFYIRVYNDNFNIYTPQGRNAISVANNGNVFNYSNTTSWQTTSDIRVKENINTIENALNVITSLNPVSFNYKQEFAEKNNWDDNMKLNNIGFIAQEFETVFPKYVYTKEYTLEDTPIEDFKSIDTGHLIPYLVKAIQELSTKNNELQEILQRNNIV
jgi:hypothetical protein